MTLLTEVTKEDRQKLDPEGLFGDGWHIEYVQGFYAGRRHELGVLVANPKPVIQALLAELLP